VVCWRRKAVESLTFPVMGKFARKFDIFKERRGAVIKTLANVEPIPARARSNFISNFISAADELSLRPGAIEVIQD